MFKRGDIVHHKIMGKSVVLNILKDKDEEKIEVRMANGHIEKFYPEELETDIVVQARDRDQIEEIMKSNEERAKKFSFQ